MQSSGKCNQPAEWSGTILEIWLKDIFKTKQLNVLKIYYGVKKAGTDENVKLQKMPGMVRHCLVVKNSLASLYKLLLHNSDTRLIQISMTEKTKHMWYN